MTPTALGSKPCSPARLICQVCGPAGDANSLLSMEMMMHRQWRSLKWSLTILLLLSAKAALAHEKWFRNGAWQPTNWHTVVQFPAVGLIAAVVVVTILAA